MLYFGEAFFGLAANALAGRVGCDQFWMEPFQPAQLPHLCVVLGVRDLWRIEHMILIFVVAELITQCLNPPGVFFARVVGAAGSGFRHNPHYRNLTGSNRKPWNPSRISLPAH